MIGMPSACHSYHQSIIIPFAGLRADVLAFDVLIAVVGLAWVGAGACTVGSFGVFETSDNCTRNLPARFEFLAAT